MTQIQQNKLGASQNLNTPRVIEEEEEQIKKKKNTKVTTETKPAPAIHGSLTLSLQQPNTATVLLRIVN